MSSVTILSRSVTAWPDCDICQTHPAVVDGKTTFGPWGYMCSDCFDSVGVGLGTGRGQILIHAEATE